MLKNGEQLEKYINGKKFEDRLYYLKGLLQDETTTNEEKLNNLKQTIEKDTNFISPESIKNTFEFGVYVALIAAQLLGLAMSIAFVIQAHSEGFFEKKFLESAALLLFGPLTGDYICEVLEK